MKLQIDTTSKTIKIENDIKISVLITNLKKMFPNNEWKNFTLVTNTIIDNWSSPTIVRIIREDPRPYYPSYPWYAYSSNEILTNYEGNYQLNSGVYNVELK